MTDKERLEEIDLNKTYNECGITGDLLSIELKPNDYYYLLEQAERVQELEKDLTKYHRETIEKIKEYNREALKDRNYTEIEALLEEIEKNLDPLGYEMSGHLVSANDIYWLVKYAKEQAERVQELEEEVERYQSGKNVAVITKMKMDVTQERNERLEKRVQELEKENKRLEDFIETIQNVHFVELQREKAENRRYREALEEIARGRFPGASYKARKALEGESE